MNGRTHELEIIIDGINDIIDTISGIKDEDIDKYGAVIKGRDGEYFTALENATEALRNASCSLEDAAAKCHYKYMVIVYMGDNQGLKLFNDEDQAKNFEKIAVQGGHKAETYEWNDKEMAYELT